MTDDWATVRLGDCVVVNDDTYSPKEAWPFINYLDTGNITMNRIAEIQQLDAAVDKVPSRARRKVRAGDIVYSMVRPNQRHFGMIKDPPENFLASTGFAVVRGKDGIADTGFLYWYLAQDHIVEQLHTIAEHSTSAYPSIRPADLEQLELRLPPMEEQRRIAGVLGCLDDKIELNRRMAETLEQIARALFRSWFVDFEPVRAKQEGRWRPGQSLPGLPAHLYDSFPDRLEPSAQGPIPTGWRLGCVADLCSKIENGGTPKRREPAYWGGQIDWFTTSELADGPLIESKEKITEAGLSKSSCKLWDPGTVLIALYASPTVGRLGILETPAASNQACSGLVARPEIGRLFLFHSLLATRDRLRDIAVGAAQQNISQQVVRNHLAILPPASIIEAFNGAVDPLWRRQVESARNAHTLAATRDALLPRVLSDTAGLLLTL